ncbi:MAG: hypothetical protein RSD57_09890 [Comamonas sp.]
MLDGLPSEAARKIELVQADAFTWVPTQSDVNFLYVDIWLGITEPQMLEDVQAMQAHVQAEQVYFWGQELALAQQAGHAWVTAQWEQVLAESARGTGLPLLIDAPGGWASWVERIWALRLSAREGVSVRAGGVDDR